MSRWVVIGENPADCTLTIAHACNGAHSPYTERHTWDFIERAFADPRYSDTATGEKPTYPCKGLCSVRRKSDSDPHLPWRGDRIADLARYGLRPALLADEMYERWKVTA